MMETPLQSALRWKQRWARAMDMYADMCTNAVLEDDSKAARTFARRYDVSKKRFWNAFAREMVAKHSETPARVNWFGDEA